MLIPRLENDYYIVALILYIIVTVLSIITPSKNYDSFINICITFCVVMFFLPLIFPEIKIYYSYETLLHIIFSIILYVTTLYISSIIKDSNEVTNTYLNILITVSTMILFFPFVFKNLEEYNLSIFLLVVLYIVFLALIPISSLLMIKNFSYVLFNIITSILFISLVVLFTQFNMPLTLLTINSSIILLGLYYLIPNIWYYYFDTEKFTIYNLYMCIFSFIMLLIGFLSIFSSYELANKEIGKLMYI